MTLSGMVASLFRYPVKSMQGERVQFLDIQVGGANGDRAFALLDVDSGQVASAHHPDKWAALLHCQARWEDDHVLVTLPDGDTLGIGAALERRLSTLFGRTVMFIEQAPDGAQYEFQLADVPGTAPAPFVDYTLGLAGVSTGRVGRLPIGMQAPQGSLVDVAPIHIITTSSLNALANAGGDADLRRFRPNVVIDNGITHEYIEHSAAGQLLDFGSATFEITMPTMRCLMTTLPQAHLDRSRETLATLARTNRLEVGPGHWACLGLYATVTQMGRIQVGDEALSRSSRVPPKDS